MKILRRGEVPKKLIPWWVGKQVTCGCKTVLVLEESDEEDGVYEGGERHIQGDRFVTVVCPVCGFNATAFKDREKPQPKKFLCHFTIEQLAEALETCVNEQFKSDIIDTDMVQTMKEECGSEAMWKQLRYEELLNVTQEQWLNITGENPNPQ